MKRLAIAALATIALLLPALAQPGDAARGQQAFRVCAPCHSLEPDRNMTGPSLADLWGRKAGGLASFERYSDALKSSGIIWDDRALDGWLTDPQRMVPDNEMPFEGIKDECCGGNRLRKLGEDVTRTLETQPRRWKVIETVRAKFTCRDCERSRRRRRRSMSSRGDGRGPASW